MTPEHEVYTSSAATYARKGPGYHRPGKQWVNRLLPPLPTNTKAIDWHTNRPRRHDHSWPLAITAAALTVGYLWWLLVVAPTVLWTVTPLVLFYTPIDPATAPYALLARAVVLLLMGAVLLKAAFGGIKRFPNSFLPDVTRFCIGAEGWSWQQCVVACSVWWITFPSLYLLLPVFSMPVAIMIGMMTLKVYLDRYDHVATANHTAALWAAGQFVVSYLRLSAGGIGIMCLLPVVHLVVRSLSH